MLTDFEQLLEKFLMDDLSPEQLSSFLASVKEPANENKLREVIERKLNNYSYQGHSENAKLPGMFRAALEKSKLLEKAVEVPFASSTPIFSFRKIAAAAVILLVVAGSYILFVRSPHRNTAQQDSQESRFKNDIAPGGNNAILTLANGNKILLDTTTNGMLARQGTTKVLKLSDGQLAYQKAATGPQSAALINYNTLSTPRGGQYQLTLSDGSRVWLNAASSIRYPTAFSGKERKVEVTGEAYFEIAKNASMPFKVNTPEGLEVEVLGTSFNLMAYEDDTIASTTLVEGAVKVSKNGTTHTLAPGRQLITGATGAMRVKDDVDIEKTVAWKNGVFIFYNDDVQTIMKQLTRWYDIDVHFEKTVNDHYSGRISRQVNISQILKMMEAAGGVSFSVQGKEVKID